MKKLILILPILILILIGCREQTIAEREADLAEAKVDADNEANRKQIQAQETLDLAKVITRDGCQYLFYTRRYLKGGMGAMAHKGDCNNPYHKQ